MKRLNHHWVDRRRLVQVELSSTDEVNNRSTDHEWNASTADSDCGLVSAFPALIRNSIRLGVC